MASLAFTWLGHSTFLFVSPGGKRLLIDPWIGGNPAAPADAAKAVQHVDDLGLVDGRHVGPPESLGRTRMALF